MTQIERERESQAFVEVPYRLEKGGEDISLEELQSIFHELATMMRNKLDIIQGLHEVARFSRKRAKAKVARALHSHLTDGLSLSIAMERYPQVFSAVQIQIMKTSESRGRVEEGVRDLAAMLIHDITLREFVRRAFLSPSMFAFGIAALMLWANWFTSGSVLKPLLQGFAVPVLLVIAAGLHLRGVSRFTDKASWAVQHCPVLLAGVLGKFKLARFARSLSACVDAGVTLPASLEAAASTSGDAHLRSTCARAATTLREGGSLAATLFAAGAVPRELNNALYSAEITGDFGDTLAKGAEIYEEEARFASMRFMLSLVGSLGVYYAIYFFGLVMTYLR